MKRTSCLLLLTLASSAFTQTLIGVKPPKLVLLISIDQFRADYVERFTPYYLPARSQGVLGGFRFLAETGADFVDAHHHHSATETGPGHATLMTGSEPALDGIIANDWLDRATGNTVYCVDDPSAQTVGGTSKPMSARNLLTTTVGDELKMATNGRSRVLGISFKDRAAILMAGHAADDVIWFDVVTGNWETSTFYAPSGKLPAWVNSLNAEKIPDKATGKTWEPLLSSTAYQLARKAPAEPQAPGGKLFSHEITSVTNAGKTSYDPFTRSSFGQEYVFQTVERAIAAEKLGRHDVPDMLVVNLATNDYVGHQFGPNSPEVLDMSIRTDRLLSELFNSLQKSIPGGIDQVAIVVTADHGVVPIPEESGGVYRTGAKRESESQILQVVNEALSKRFGAGKWVLGSGLYGAQVYLDRSLIAAAHLKSAEVEDEAAAAASKAPGVYCAFTRSNLLTGALPSWDWVQSVVNEYNPDRGGDILVFGAPGYFFGAGTGTGHGVPWAYDTHVPLLVRGPGINPGMYSTRVYTSDIASTLCHLLGIEYPTGNLGRPLPALSSSR